ncbi:DNA ligase [Serratia phage 4S]|nr:DNA ligase [Serratia phage 4S]
MNFEIRSNFPWPSNALSNFAKHPFVMDGLSFAGMEGFIQGLKIQNVKLQERVFTLVGIEAYRAGQQFTVKNQTVYWRGTPLNRLSEAYDNLVHNAYYHMAFQNKSFRDALVATGDKVLTHPLGSNDKFKTMFTEKEFCDKLTEIRELVRNTL